jgi:hypothetical protein
MSGSVAAASSSSLCGGLGATALPQSCLAPRPRVACQSTACCAAADPQDFFSKDCWAHHPKPYGDFVAFKAQEQERLEAERKKLVRL